MLLLPVYVNCTKHSPWPPILLLADLVEVSPLPLAAAAAAAADGLWPKYKLPSLKNFDNNPLQGES